MIIDTEIRNGLERRGTEQICFCISIHFLSMYFLFLQECLSKVNFHFFSYYLLYIYLENIYNLFLTIELVLGIFVYFLHVWWSYSFFMHSSSHNIWLQRGRGWLNIIHYTNTCIFYYLHILTSDRTKIRRGKKTWTSLLYPQSYHLNRKVYCPCITTHLLTTKTLDRSLVRTLVGAFSQR